MVKCCGVCPVYINPNETKPTTVTLKIVANGDSESTDKAGTSVPRSVEKELEPSSKRVCR